MSSIKPQPDPPRIGALLRRAWQYTRQQIYVGVRSEGYGDLSPAHVAMFRYPGLEGYRPSQLAEQMQITKQSVNDLLRGLEDNGYIALERDPKDSRARRVRLTKRGWQLDAAVRRHARTVEQHLSQAVGRKSFKQFLDTLTRIANLDRSD